MFTIKKNTTHNFLHERGLIVLENDLDSMVDLLKYSTSNADSINKNHINIVKESYNQLILEKELYINTANDPDINERDFHPEKYMFKKNIGITVKKLKGIKLPCMYTQHFYSPQEGTNYINSKSKLIMLLCQIKNDKIREFGYQLEKQGLTFNAMNLFILHTVNAIKLVEDNKYVLNKDVIVELSKATHYLEDMCETHHVTNKIGRKKLAFLEKVNTRFSNHNAFEKYAFKNKEKYLIDSVRDFHKIVSLREEEKYFWEHYNYYGNFLNHYYLSNTKGVKCFEQLCRLNALYSSVFAAGICDFYDNGESDYSDKAKWALSDNQDDWDKNLEQTLKMAQISVSVYLFSFLLYISYPKLFEFPL